MDQQRLKFVGEISFGSEAMAAGTVIKVKITAESERGLARGWHEVAKYIERTGLHCNFSYHYSMRIRLKRCAGGRFDQEIISFSLRAGKLGEVA